MTLGKDTPFLLSSKEFTQSIVRHPTLHRVFKRLDIIRFEGALRDWSRQNLGDEEAIAIDGKGLLGIHGEELPGVRLLAAYTPKLGLVLSQKGEIVS